MSWWWRSWWIGLAVLRSVLPEDTHDWQVARGLAQFRADEAERLAIRDWRR